MLKRNELPSHRTERNLESEIHCTLCDSRYVIVFKMIETIRSMTGIRMKKLN